MAKKKKKKLTVDDLFKPTEENYRLFKRIFDEIDLKKKARVAAFRRPRVDQ